MQAVEAGGYVQYIPFSLTYLLTYLLVELQQDRRKGPTDPCGQWTFVAWLCGMHADAVELTFKRLGTTTEDHPGIAARGPLDAGALGAFFHSGVKNASSRADEVPPQSSLFYSSGFVFFFIFIYLICFFFCHFLTFLGYPPCSLSYLTTLPFSAPVRPGTLRRFL